MKKIALVPICFLVLSNFAYAETYYKDSFIPSSTLTPDQEEMFDRIMKDNAPLTEIEMQNILKKRFVNVSNTRFITKSAGDKVPANKTKEDKIIGEIFKQHFTKGAKPVTPAQMQKMNDHISKRMYELSVQEEKMIMEARKKRTETNEINKKLHDAAVETFEEIKRQEMNDAFAEALKEIAEKENKKKYHQPASRIIEDFENEREFNANLRAHEERISKGNKVTKKENNSGKKELPKFKYQKPVYIHSVSKNQQPADYNKLREFFEKDISEAKKYANGPKGGPYEGGSKDDVAGLAIEDKEFEIEFNKISKQFKEQYAKKTKKALERLKEVREAKDSSVVLNIGKSLKAKRTSGDDWTLKVEIFDDVVNVKPNQKIVVPVDTIEQMITDRLDEIESKQGDIADEVMALDKRLFGIQQIIQEHEANIKNNKAQLEEMEQLKNEQRNLDSIVALLKKLNTKRENLIAEHKRLDLRKPIDKIIEDVKVKVTETESDGVWDYVGAETTLKTNEISLRSLLIGKNNSDFDYFNLKTEQEYRDELWSDAKERREELKNIVNDFKETISNINSTEISENTKLNQKQDAQRDFKHALNVRSNVAQQLRDSKGKVFKIEETARTKETQK